MRIDCEKCGAAMWVDDAGYIRHRGFLWLSTIPLATMQAPKQDKFLKMALKEVERIAPEGKP